jgi:hypothetical protein
MLHKTRGSSSLVTLLELQLLSNRPPRPFFSQSLLFSFPSAIYIPISRLSPRTLFRILLQHQQRTREAHPLSRRRQDWSHVPRHPRHVRQMLKVSGYGVSKRDKVVCVVCPAQGRPEKRVIQEPFPCQRCVSLGIWRMDAEDGSWVHHGTIIEEEEMDDSCGRGLLLRDYSCPRTY